MKKVLLAVLLAVIAVSNAQAAGKNRDFSTLGASIKYSYSKPDGWGPKYKDTYLEADGVHRYGPLDLYWYIDYSNLFRTPKLSDKFYSSPDYMYGEINPRISVDWLSGADLGFLFFKEWFLAYNFEFDNEKGNGKGMLRHYLGIGTDFDLPLFDYAKANIYARYIQKNYGRSENRWDGYMLNMSYGMTIHKFKIGISLGYSGWLKWVFGAGTGGDSPDNRTTDSVQWNNTFDISYGGFSILYTYQVNVNYSEVRQNSSGVHNQAVGIKYSLTF